MRMLVIKIRSIMFEQKYPPVSDGRDISTTFNERYSFIIELRWMALLKAVSKFCDCNLLVCLFFHSVCYALEKSNGAVFVDINH